MHRKGWKWDWSINNVRKSGKGAAKDSFAIEMLMGLWIQGEKNPATLEWKQQRRLVWGGVKSIAPLYCSSQWIPPVDLVVTGETGVIEGVQAGYERRGQELGLNCFNSFQQCDSTFWSGRATTLRQWHHHQRRSPRKTGMRTFQHGLSKTWGTS